MSRGNLNYTITKKEDIKPVERLLEFQFVDGKIVRTETQPINIKLSEFGESRNWEGIVRLDNIGFLIVTDRFPGTILAFISPDKLLFLLLFFSITILTKLFLTLRPPIIIFFDGIIKLTI